MNTDPAKGARSYEWSARRAASANPNALIADREEIRSGANRGAGSIRPPPDAMSIARGTSVVGSEWGAASSSSRRGGGGGGGEAA